MNYSKFCRLVSGGEKDTVDFKIMCTAFCGGRDAAKGELAKDICAMANNGRRQSFILVGVSDDGRSFRTASGNKLTDDRLQDFCKKAILPPPKVRVLRKRWRSARRSHSGKEFVIVTIGPNRRHAYRLSRDFIEYRPKVCLRRNDVWVRRNATSDLATPEEVVDLMLGESRRSTGVDDQLREERRAFTSLSQREQLTQVSEATAACLKILKLVHLRDSKWSGLVQSYGGWFEFSTSWRKAGSTAVIVVTRNCSASLTKSEMQRAQWSGLFDAYPARWETLPKEVRRLTRRRIRAIRRLCVIPVLKSVPSERISGAFPSARRLGQQLFFYRPSLSEWASSREDKAWELPSSSELLVLDRIQSISEFRDLLRRTIESVLEMDSTVVRPQ